MFEEQESFTEAIYKATMDTVDSINDNLQEFIDELKRALEDTSDLWDTLADMAVESCNSTYGPVRTSQYRPPCLVVTSISSLLLKHCYRTGFL